MALFGRNKGFSVVEYAPLLHGTLLEVAKLYRNFGRFEAIFSSDA